MNLAPAKGAPIHVPGRCYLYSQHATFKDGICDGVSIGYAKVYDARAKVPIWRKLCLAHLKATIRAQTVRAVDDGCAMAVILEP